MFKQTMMATVVAAALMSMSAHAQWTGTDMGPNSLVTPFIAGGSTAWGTTS